jgi:DNA-binding MarR family transcriptional regulator
MDNYIFLMAVRAPLTRALTHRGDEPHLLREVIQTYQALMSGFSRGVGMSASRFALLRQLANAPERGLGITELARELGIDAAAVARLVKEMQDERLVLRRSDVKDGRRNYVRLSAKGLRDFARIHERAHSLEESLASIISTNEMSAAVSVLTKLRKFMQTLRMEE